MSIKNLLVWTGGKSRLIPEIDKRIPKDINRQYDTYVEPFVGGGSVMFHILNNYDFKKIYVNDKNKELINLYLAIKNFPKKMTALFLIKVRSKIQPFFSLNIPGLVKK